MVQAQKKNLSNNIEEKLVWESLTKFSSSNFLVIDKNYCIYTVYNTVYAKNFIGKSLYDFVHPEHVELYKKKIKKVTQSKKADYIKVSGIKSATSNEKSWYKTEIIPIIQNKKVEYYLLVANNITEEKTLEIARNKSELEIVLSQSPAIIWTTDTNLVFTSSNGSGLKKLDQKPNEVTGVSLYDLFSTSDKEFLPIRMHLNALKGKKVKYEHVFKNVHFQTYLKPLFNGKKIVGCIGISFDITDRKNSERKLQEKERTLSNLMNNLPGMVYRCANDKHWTMFFISNGCYDLTGYTEKEMLNNKKKSYSDIIVPEDRTYIIKQVNSALKNKKHFELQYRIKPKKGQEKWVWERGEGVYSDEGKLLYLEGFITDITARKEFELKIKSSEDNYRRLVELSPDGIFIHDLKGYVIFANPSALKIMGINHLSELKNKSIFHYILPQYHSTVKKRRMEFGKGNKSLPFLPIKIKNAVGEVLDIESKPIPFIFEGKYAVLVVYHDLTQQRKIEKEQMRLQIVEETNKQLKEEIKDRKNAEQKLKQSLQEKEVLLKEVHHRVKNNLQVISSILNLQSSYITDEYTINLFKESQNRIKSMAFIHETLYQTKDFSRINIADYLTNVVKNLVHSYSLQKVETELLIEKIDMNIDTAIPCGLVVNEIISNSLKYAFINKENPQLYLSVKNYKSDLIKIRVGDNGVGLPNGFDYKSSATLGMQLIFTLAEQINADVKIDTNNGVHYTIIFKNT
ncbi:MAG: PAS domain S-box protein [Bacteroidetes bacterium]|nr:PAS domain S-box protein [Bacteroidota bacterium]